MPDLDVSKGHTDAGELNADVVSAAVLHQADGGAAGRGQLPECCVFQNLHNKPVIGTMIGLGVHRCQCRNM